jgi:hypothetical protein
MWAYTNPVFAQACIKNGLSAYKSYLKAEEYRKGIDYVTIYLFQLHRANVLICSTEHNILEKL